MKFVPRHIAFAAVIALVASAPAGAVTVTVNATDDLYNGTAPGVYDGTAPVAVDVAGLTSITFSVSGGKTVTVDTTSGDFFNDADGIGSVSTENINATDTLSGIYAPTAGFLAGAFVGASVSSSVPGELNFSSGALGTSFTSLAPTLQQTFFIGDGLTGDATGTTQTFFVPTGATTLYLGLTDACGYAGSPSCLSDNAGSFTVTTQSASVTAVPEPSGIGLMFTGLAGVAFGVRRRRAAAGRN